MVAKSVIKRRLERVMSDNIETIDLDCPPGGIRPGNLIKGVLEGLDIEPITYDVTPFFGNAEYAFRVPKDEWVAKYQSTIKERITALYNSGVIRYGSW
jgi:hypothetical protein